MSELIKLAMATQRINTLSQTTVSYGRVLNAVLCGQVPGEMRGGRWYIAESAVPAAAELLGGSKTRVAA